jgi:hypothetical protein
MDNKYISTRRHLHRFKENNVLVESGSLTGDGVQDALNCGYKQVISFEVAQPLFEHCRDRFKKKINVHIINDTSANMFPYIKEIKEPMTFWLDGHYSGGTTSYKDVYCPILQELDAIAQHPVKTHAILIDDVRLFGTAEFDYIKIEDVQKKILSINPEYTFCFLDGHCKNDILCASVKK